MVPDYYARLEVDPRADRAEIAVTVDDRSEVEGEIRALWDDLGPD